jgi:hypothetical protein
MKRILNIAAILIAAAATLTAASTSQPTSQPNNAAEPTAHFWTGVWQVKAVNKPGVVITVADDNGALAGTIVFDIYKSQTNEHIGTEPRMLVNPHMEGNSLAFQVRRILKPHLKGEPPSDASDPTDIVEMTLTPTTEGKAMLNCAKCGGNAPTEVVKAE